jgi:hypothetical protein
MAQLAAWVDERQSGGGVLLVIDRAPKDGREHAYGSFVGDGAAVAAYWRHLTGGSPAAAKLRAVRGWRDHLRGDSRELLGNFSHILGYTVRPWPSQHGRRDLERDAVASLAFFRPWRDALASVQPMALMLAQSAYASPTRSEASRICPYCGRAIPPDKRSDSRFCNRQHKANYHRDQKKLAARAANPGAGAAQGGQRDP